MKLMKRLLMVITIAALVTTGITFALLNDTTNTAVNAFSSDRQLSVLLREPAWDGYEFGDSYEEGKKPGEIANPEYEGSSILGIKTAQNYYPNDTIKKNPIIKNNSVEGENEIVAIKVQFLVIEEGVEKILTKNEFNTSYARTVSGKDSDQDGIHDAFVNISDTDQFDIYMFGSKKEARIVEADCMTEHLFDAIQVNKDIKTDRDGNLPKFQIKVTAIAVQSNLDMNTTINELRTLAN